MWKRNNIVGHNFEDFIDSNPTISIENRNWRTSHPNLLLFHRGLERDITHELKRRVKRYSSFWNSNLQNLMERDDAGEKENLPEEDCIVLRKCQVVLKKAIIESKRTSYRSFLEKLDFRRDGIRAHRVLTPIT
ncbi:hypothetical protein CDAR_618731 [Caerostris darwini]|uniref:Uncharacterized protein n=1 Tax=Caerostris darwini TaxID=1538125 RepID=A0AAV4WRN3_9ARAC|nr:hypothetical protein CDAR_618731 [Caerostris darwini]